MPTRTLFHVAMIVATLFASLAGERSASAAGFFFTNGVLHVQRYYQSATVLQSGKVLVAGV